MLPTVTQVRKADEYMAQASEKANAEGQFVVYGRAWKLLKHLDDPAYYARQRDCLTKLITICHQITSWDDAERDAAIAKYQTALDKLPPLLSAEEKALLTKVRRLMDKGMTSDNVNSQFLAYQQAWKQLKKQKSPALMPTMRDCLEKLMAVCRQMADWEEEERNEAIQKYRTILAGLSGTASTPLATAPPATPLLPAAAASQPVIAGPTSSSAMPGLAPKITELFSVVPFANTEKLVQAYQLQKERCLQHPEDGSAKQHLHDIEDIIQDKIIANEIKLSQASLKQSVVLLGAGLIDKTMQLLMNQLFELIADNPLDFLDEFTATNLGMMKAGDKLTDTQLTQITSSLVQQMQGLHAPDIAMTCLVLNTLYQTLATMISKQVSHISQALHLKPIKAALYNLNRRLHAVDTKSHNAVEKLQWADIEATIKYALDGLTRFSTEKTPWQQRAHYARITGALLLQAVGVGGAVVESVGNPVSAGGAINAAAGLLYRLWRRGKTIYRYCHCRQSYFAALKKWQVDFVKNVLPKHALWDHALKSLRLPIEDNDKSRLWLKNSNAQVGVMRTLMAVYDAPIQGIDAPKIRATLQKKTVQLLTNYYQQSINQPEESHQLVRLTAAQHLLSLQPQLTALQTAHINTLITSADRELIKSIQAEQTTADEARVITIDSQTNIALQGWRQSYPDDEELYRLLRSYPTLPAAEKGGFLLCMQEFVKYGSTKKISYWGREVIAALGEEFVSAIRRLPACGGSAGPAKFTSAAIMAAARGRIIAHKEDIDEAKRVKMAMLRDHLGILNDMATQHGLFDRWEARMDKWHIGDLVAAGMIEATVTEVISPNEVDVEILSGQADAAALVARTKKTQPLVAHCSDSVPRGTDTKAAVIADVAPNPFASYSHTDNSTIFIFGQLSIDPQFPIDSLLDKLAVLLRSGRQGLSLELMQLAERFDTSGTSERALYCYAAAYCAHLQDQSLCPPRLVPCIERLLNTLADIGFAPDARLRCMQKPNNAEGETWLHYFIATYPALHLIDYLLDQEQHRWQLQARYRGKTPLMLAIQSGDDALCRQLLAHGATISDCDDTGNTCLHLACQQGFSKVISDLLAAIKPLSTEVVGSLNAAGDTVLHALCVSGCDEWRCYEDILRRFPSAVNQRNLADYFPLQLAACYAPLEIFTELQIKTTVVLSAGEDGKTCLHLAAEFGNAAIVQLLAPQGEVNALDGMQCTPLQLAARGRQLGKGRNAEDYRQVFIALLQHGADETLRNGQGQTVRDMVSQYQEIQEVFEQAWAQLAPQRLLQRWQAECTMYYTQSSFVNKRLFDKDYFSLKDYFVNLRVVKKEESSNVSQSKQNKLSYKPLRERDRLDGEKKEIKLSQLFDSNTYQGSHEKASKEINTVLVSGAAGVGKTTLSDYIAYQWALFKEGATKEKGVWSAFEAVLMVRCRELHPKQLGPKIKEWDIAQLVQCACWRDLNLSVDHARALLKKLQEKPDKTLLLLDGLDELPGEMRSYWRSLLRQLFRLPFKKLVTTRPYAIDNLRQWLNHEKLVEISGFRSEDVPVYFKKVLGDTKETKEFIEALNRSQYFMEMAHIPINAYLLKRWRRSLKSKQNITTLADLSQSDLYESLLVDLCRRSIHREEERELKKAELKFNKRVTDDEHMKAVLTVLGQWAFEGLVRDSTDLNSHWLGGVTPQAGEYTLLTEENLAQIDIEALEQSGLIKQVKKMSDGQEYYCFLHLTFQEFLAARVIASCLKEGTDEQKALISQIIHTNKYHPNFTLVWPFVSGLLKRDPEVLNEFFIQLFTKAPKDWVGIIEGELLIHCLEASLLPNSQLSPMQQRLLRGIKQLRCRRSDTQNYFVKSFISCPLILHYCVDEVLMMLQSRGLPGNVLTMLATTAIAKMQNGRKEVFDGVLSILRHDKVTGTVRAKLAEAVVVYLPQYPDKINEACNVIIDLLKNKDIDRWARGSLARTFMAQLPQYPNKINERCDKVLALFKHEDGDGRVRCELVEHFITQLPQFPDKMSEGCDMMLTLVKDKDIVCGIRYKLAEAFVVQLPQLPQLLDKGEVLDALLVLLKDKDADGRVRSRLAKAFVAQLPQLPDKREVLDAVLALLKDKDVSGWVRYKLAKAFITQLLQLPDKVNESCEVVIALMRVMDAEGWGRYKLAKVFVAQLPQLIDKEQGALNAVLILLKNKKVDSRDRATIARFCVTDILQLPQLLNKWEEVFEAVIILLKNEYDETHDKLAQAFFARLLVLLPNKWEEVYDKLTALLNNKDVHVRYRCKLAKTFVVDLFPDFHNILLNKMEEIHDAVLALVKNEAIDNKVPGKLIVVYYIGNLLSGKEGAFEEVIALLKNEGLDSRACAELVEAFVDQLIKFSNKVNRIDMELIFIAQLLKFPNKMEERCETVIALLKNGNIKDGLRYWLAKAFIAQLSQFSNKIDKGYDAVLAFLKDKNVERWNRADLAKDFIAQLPQYSDKVNKACDLVMALMVDKDVDGWVRGRLAKAFVARLPQFPDKVNKACDLVLTLVKDKDVAIWSRAKLAKALVKDKDASWTRIKLAKAFVAQFPDKRSYMALDLLKDEDIDKGVRCDLAEVFLAQLPDEGQGMLDTVLGLLKNKDVDGWVRCKLAKIFLTQLPQFPDKMTEGCNIVLILMRDKNIPRRACCKLTKAFVAQLPQLLGRGKGVFDLVLALLKDKDVDEWVRSRLAKAFVAQFPDKGSYMALDLLKDEDIDSGVRCELAEIFLTQLPDEGQGTLDAVLGLLKNKDIDGWVRCKLAKIFLTQLPQFPDKMREGCDIVLTLVKDKNIAWRACCKLAKAFVAQLPQLPDKGKGVFDLVLALLQDKEVDGWVRGSLAEGFFTQLPQFPDKVNGVCDVMLALLQDKDIDKGFRGGLAEAYVAQLPWFLDKVNEAYDAVLGLLKNANVDGWVRCKLAEGFLVQLPQLPQLPEKGKEVLDAVLALLKNKDVDWQACFKLAKIFVAQLPQLPEKGKGVLDAVLALLKDKEVDDRVRCRLTESFLAQLPQYPERATEVCDTVMNFLKDKDIDRWYRCIMTDAFVTQLSQLPDKEQGAINAVLALVKDKNVDVLVCTELAFWITGLLQLPQLLNKWEEVFEAVITLLKNEYDESRYRMVKAFVARLLVLLPNKREEVYDKLTALLKNKHIHAWYRCELAKRFVVDLFPGLHDILPNKMGEIHDAVLALMKNEAIDKKARCILTNAYVTKLPDREEKVFEAVITLLKDEDVDSRVRAELAMKFVAQLPSKVNERCDIAQAFVTQLLKFLNKKKQRFDTIIDLLKNSGVKGEVLCKLAKAFITQLPQYPDKVSEACDAVLALLKDKEVSGDILANLAEDFVTQLPLLPNKGGKVFDAVLACLKNKDVDSVVCYKLTESLVARLLQLLSKVEVFNIVITLLKNSGVKGEILCKLAKAFITQLPQYPDKVNEACDAVLALLKDKEVNGDILANLAEDFVTQLPLLPNKGEEVIDVVLACLKNKDVDGMIYCKLAEGLVAQLHLLPNKRGEMFDLALDLLKDGHIEGFFRVQLAKAIAEQLPQFPNKRENFLDILLDKDMYNRCLLTDMNIPLYLILDRYNDNEDVREYLIKQLLKQRILLIEREGKVWVMQAGQTKPLELSPELSASFEKIKQDMKFCRLAMDDMQETQRSQPPQCLFTAMTP